MSRPITVTIPHNLGQEVALKRIHDGIAQARASYAGKFSVIEENWSGNKLDYSIMVLKQKISGSIEVEENTVLVSVLLPVFLAALAEKAKALIQQRAQLMLEKK